MASDSQNHVPSPDGNFGIAFGIVCTSAVASAMGGAAVFSPSIVKLATRRVLASSLGISAGVMLYASLITVFQDSFHSFQKFTSNVGMAYLLTTLCFFCGVFFMLIVGGVVKLLSKAEVSEDTRGNSAFKNNEHRSEHESDRSHPDNYQNEASFQAENGLGCTNDPLSQLQDCQHSSDFATTKEGRQNHGVNNMWSESVQTEDTRPLSSFTERFSSLVDCDEAKIDLDGEMVERRNTRNLETMQEECDAFRSERGSEFVGVEKAQDSRQGMLCGNEDEEWNSANIETAEEEVRTMLQQEAAEKGETCSSHEEAAVIAPADANSHDFEFQASASNERDEDVNEKVTKLSSMRLEVRDNERIPLSRMGFKAACAIALHNFPEGLATFVVALGDAKVGAVLAIAVAVHNIPEGLCVALPIFYADGNHWRAFAWAVFAGATEAFAALIGWALIRNHLNDKVYGVLFGFVSGIMTMISLTEVLPTSHRFDHSGKVVTYSLIVGMLIMATFLVIFGLGT
eukprot:CAMPEP_0195520402 /NCGR_PEP_ID=MMETSP0794_2-20130614/16773_1 /TAXON_ID=515487 /ORGANISM="Stephanopyxis turris, Strain CCMP 815" /LENGTH=512 /DNA_ID=CAMNT_0040649749 /DNA_START=26 /DNA_END=1564 /DNA_ORIENTATION=-